MPLRLLILSTLLLGLSLKSQAQLHVMPETWPRPRFNSNQEERTAVLRSLLTQLEAQRLDLMSHGSRKERQAIDARIRVVRQQLQRQQVQPPTPEAGLRERQARWKRLIAQLEPQRQLTLQKPATKTSKTQVLAIEAEIRTARELLQREEENVQLLSR